MKRPANDTTMRTDLASLVHGIISQMTENPTKGRELEMEYSNFTTLHSESNAGRSIRRRSEGAFGQCRTRR